MSRASVELIAFEFRAVQDRLQVLRQEQLALKTAQPRAIDWEKQLQGLEAVTREVESYLRKLGRQT